MTRSSMPLTLLRKDFFNQLNNSQKPRAEWVHVPHSDMYRVFIKYCVIFQEFSKVCQLSLASTRLLLVVQKITSQ